MHFIPKIKHIKTKKSFYENSLGFSIENIPVTLTKYCYGLLPSLHEQGFPILFESGSVDIPNDIPHHQKLKKQAYKLEITKDAVLIKSSGKEGFRNAIATLRQIWMQNLSKLPSLVIEDYPSVPSRGVMLDVSRGKIPTLQKIEELVELLASYKYNVLQLYMEDCFILESHPELGILNGFYTKENIKWVDKLCKSYGIELQPNIQSLSHVHGLVRNPSYYCLAEGPSLFSFGATNAEVYSLLDDIMKEVLPWFSSKILNINLDEAYDLGTCYSKDIVKQKGAKKVFIEHIKTVASIARKNGAKKIFLWGDCLSTYPGIVEELDDDVFFIDWNYNPLETFPSLKNHDGNKKPFWVAPGTSSWNALFPRVQNANTNLKNFVMEGYKRKAEGVLVTHWGDYGHHQPISFSYYGFAVGAEHAYNGGKTSQEDLNAATQKHLFVDKKQEEGFNLLSQTNLLPSITTDFKSQSFYALFDDFFKGLSIVGDDKYLPISEETFIKLQSLGEKAILAFEQSNDFSIFNEELIQAAACIEFVGRKGMLSYKIKNAFNSDKVDEKNILSWIIEIKLLYRDFLKLRQQFSYLWDVEALDIGKEGALYFFDNAGTRFAQAVIWLNTQRLILAEGGKVDTKMESYKANEGYTTLWTSDCTNLWDRAYPWR